MKEYAISHNNYGGFACRIKAKNKKQALYRYLHSIIIKINQKDLTVRRIK